MPDPEPPLDTENFPPSTTDQKPQTINSKPAALPGEISRAWLYVLALVLVGVLVAPLAWAHPRLKHGEKIFIVLLGLLNTLAAIAAAVLFFFWFLAYLRRLQAGAPAWPP